MNSTKVNSGHCKHADNIIQHCMEEIDIYICFLLQSLIALEHEHQGQRMSLAGSVNNINARNSDEEEEDQKEEEIGRVAGWAVNFEKLLKDGSGLVVFTVRFKARQTWPSYFLIRNYPVTILFHIRREIQVMHLKFNFIIIINNIL